jgi:hypothetical protein
LSTSTASRRSFGERMPSLLTSRAFKSGTAVSRTGNGDGGGCPSTMGRMGWAETNIAKSANEVATSSRASKLGGAPGGGLTGDRSSAMIPS